MKFYYLDSSALAKVYALEKGSDQVRNMVRSARADPPTARVLIGSISVAEVAAAIVRKERDKDITRAEASRLLSSLDSDFRGPAQPYVVIEPSTNIIADAAVHARDHQMRGYDAVQLATALAARHSSPPDAEFFFVVCDGPLAQAARTENFQVIDPS